jgi:DNA mismatch repair protein MutS2
MDLRGLSSDEAMDKVDKYLDDAFLAGLSTVQVIQGKGTGVLRKRMQKFLKGHLKVESYRLGEWDEGGSEVTVVKLKE